MRVYRTISALGVALSLNSSLSSAQTTPDMSAVLVAPAAARVGDAPDAPGTGAAVQFYHGFFQGHPFSIEDARDMLEGRSIVPIFDVYCGMVPYVDFTNATVPDSLNRSGSPVLCLPFLTTDLGDAAAPCARVDGYPTGRYAMGGGAVMRVRGLYAAREAGTVTFAWGHDDGFTFHFGETPVFEYPGPTGSRVDRRVVQFERPGLYQFQLDWYDGVGGALIDWYVARGEQRGETLDPSVFALVSQRDLYPADGLPCTLDCQPCGAEAPRCDHARSRCVVCRSDAECGSNQRCDDGRCVPRVSAPSDAGQRDAGAVDAGFDAGPMGVDPGPSGCGCSAGGVASARSAGLALVFGVYLSQRRRRRSKVSSAPLS